MERHHIEGFLEPNTVQVAVPRFFLFKYSNHCCEVGNINFFLQIGRLLGNRARSYSKNSKKVTNGNSS